MESTTTMINNPAVNVVFAVDEINNNNTITKKTPGSVQQVIDNFCLADSYSPEVSRNPKTQSDLKAIVFNWINEHHVKMFDSSIDDPLRFTADQHQQQQQQQQPPHLAADQCWHHLIAKIERVCVVLTNMCKSSRFQHNVYIFLPYCKRLREILCLFQRDFCCQKKVSQCTRLLDEMIAEALHYMTFIRSVHERVAVMLVFAETRVFQCNICNESSAEEHFLKADECCGYSICYACYAKLWEFCTGMYPVCPVCKTSFKSSSKKRLQKQQHQQQLEELDISSRTTALLHDER
uniref:Immediate early transactivator 0 n=1 Tax=Lymantria dispar multicapsid nuclear polyhedrosis virus TaxID=10449 RepID=A0A1B1MQQ6_NPVLD|nr:immediate early transactivator 0 [Lymantria dispar multiple nucleopolyhedrovirus]